MMPATMESPAPTVLESRFSRFLACRAPSLEKKAAPSPPIETASSSIPPARSALAARIRSSSVSMVRPVHAASSLLFGLAQSGLTGASRAVFSASPLVSSITRAPMSRSFWVRFA